MNQLKNLRYNDSLMQRLFGDGQRVISKMLHDTPRTYYDTTTNKWMIENNLGNYEEWGLMPTVATLEGVTTYKGKLVICGGHEYKWTGTEWTDLGSGGEEVVSLTGSTTSSYWVTDYTPTINTCIEIKFQKDTAVGTWSHLFGSSVAYGSSFGLFIKNDNRYIGTRLGTSGQWNNNAFSYTQGTLYTCLLKNGLFSVNGVTITNPSISSMSLQYPLWIGASVEGGNKLDAALAGKIYYLKIWEDNTLVRDYQPQADLTFKCSQTQSVATLVGSATAQTVGTIPEQYPAQPVTAFFRLADSFSVINPRWNYTVSATEEIVDNIATATPSLPNVWDKTTSKWYIKNNLNTYEEWGVMPTVESLEDVTTYTGKLVLCGGHEYKWTGSVWTDLGEGGTHVVSLTGSTASSYWITDYVPTNLSKIEMRFNRATAITSWTSPFGCKSSSTYSKIQVYIERDDRAIKYNYGLPTEYSTGRYFTPNTDYVISISPTNVVINGTTVATYTSSLSGVTRPLWLGGMNMNGSLDAHALAGRIYYMKIWEGDTLVRDYQPQADLTFKCSLTQNVASLVGSATAQSESSLPEVYPTRQPATTSQTKASYSTALTGSYMNGQVVTVYGTNYDVVNGRLEAQN